jgi:anaerobic ribonucleoside-triphosphate reductase
MECVCKFNDYDNICVNFRKCYQKQKRKENKLNKSKYITCKQCGKESLHVAHRMCGYVILINTLKRYLQDVCWRRK